MILDVEILEVNRTKAEQLGLNFGQLISVAYPEFRVTDSWNKALRSGSVTLPPTTLQYFKQDYLDYIEGRTAPRLSEKALVGAH